jgi:DNA-nicking Smr family endonuclease
MRDRDHLLWLAINKKTKCLEQKHLPAPPANTRERSQEGSIAKQTRARIVAEAKSEEHKRSVVTGLAQQTKNLGVEQLSSKKMRAINIESCIDLHGCTQKQAEHSVREFLYKSFFARKTWVKIITGKSGVLFHFVPDLLVEYRMFVSACARAPQSDGGSGALYVRIRKWDGKSSASKN